MDINEIYVDPGIRYISEIPGYILPNGQCIVDKGVCGCGYTEYCIRPENGYDTILCSPRITLLENKVDQHPGELNLFYLQNKLLKKEFEGTYGKIKDEDLSINNKKWMDYTSDIIRSHILNCRSSGYPVRILCTYDSFHLVLNAIGPDRIFQFHVVVDEFQSLFLDSFFKPDTERDFFELLQSVPNVIYLSATPMLEKHMMRLDGFKNLPYYKFIWPSDYVTIASILEKWVSDPYKEVLKIIEIYKNRPLDRPWKETRFGIKFSEEVVFYVNSVSMIKKIISKANLEPQEVNIICSDTSKNEKLFKKILSPSGQSFYIGKIPKKGESHKMFTFCTRAVYLGADFYSTSASSVIVSDANIKSLVLDIRLDLPQILGRQRLLENPWKNECLIFYKTLGEDKPEVSWEEFKEYTDGKKKDSLSLLEHYSNDTESGRMRLIKSLFPTIKNSEESVASGRIEYYFGKTFDGSLVYNPLLELAEERAWELTQKYYKDQISVVQSIANNKNVSVFEYSSKIDNQAQLIIDKLRSYPKYQDKLKVYCEIRDALDKKGGQEELIQRIIYYVQSLDLKLEDMYSHFGLSGCRATGYQGMDLKKKLQDEFMSDPLKNSIMSNFEVGQKYTLKDIKQVLSSIYSALGITKTPKAVDLGDYYVLKEYMITDTGTKKRSRGYQLISIK